MDKELTIQDLETQADALLAAADEMEELLPADTARFQLSHPPSHLCNANV